MSRSRDIVLTGFLLAASTARRFLTAIHGSAALGLPKLFGLAPELLNLKAGVELGGYVLGMIFDRSFSRLILIFNLFGF